MDYLTLITQQKQDKLALIEDEEEYTYARLAQAARELHRPSVNQLSGI